MNRQELTEKHSFIKDAIFRTKANLLTVQRFVKDFQTPLKKQKRSSDLLKAPIISTSTSDLWNPFDTPDNWILTAGKIENLRIASRKIHGIEVGANEIFSFWKHIGNPNFGNDYVVGREIREGCIVPTVAGGLCQLSNALYDAALKATFEIIERHKHTKVIKGSLAEQDRDATVKWNYIDLRFRATFPFRIEIELTENALIVVFKGFEKNVPSHENTSNQRNTSLLNDCFSCGNLACFKHPSKPTKKESDKKTTYILSEKWPEYEAYIDLNKQPKDLFILPIKSNFLWKFPQYNWRSSSENPVKYNTFTGLLQAIKRRIRSKKSNIFEISLEVDKAMALAAIREIPIESTHLVVSQTLLPFLYDSGVFGGRTYDVLMTRLPIQNLQNTLDFAHTKYPESPTLKDFRASAEIIDLENKALTRARKIITPHAYIAEIFKNKVELLSWAVPTSVEKGSTVNATGILFPASAVARKGAYELRELLKTFSCKVYISGNAIEYDGFWGELPIEKFEGDFSKISCVVYPAYVEHQPRLLLKAIALGIPVFCSSACGLAPSEKVILLDDFCLDSLILGVKNVLNSDYLQV